MNVQKAIGQWLRISVFSLCAGFMFFSGLAKATEDNESVSVFVSIPPYSFVVEEIGGKHVDVNVLLPPGANPATYSPSSGQLTNISRADLFFRAGVPYEEVLIQKIQDSAPALDIVDLREGIELRRFEHSHKQDHGHDDKRVVDPHAWLDPMRVKKQAVTITDALCQRDPEHEDMYQERLQALHSRLDDLDAELEEMLQPVRGKKMFVFHPAFGYFADAYGLQQQPIEREGKKPGPKELNRIVRKAREHGVTTVFVQKQFSTRGAKAVAGALGGEVEVLDPLSSDYMENMRDMAETIAADVKEQTSSSEEQGTPH